MKHLSDLTDYKGILPYASEVFGVYQPLLGWKSARIQRRIDVSTQDRFAHTLRSILATVQPTVKAEFNPADRQLRVNDLTPARIAKKPAFAAIVIDRIADALPPRRKYSPEVWDELLNKDSLVEILKGGVAEQAQSVYRQRAGMSEEGPNAAAEAESAAAELLAEESRTAGVLEILRKTGQYSTLEQLFYGDERQANTLLDLLRTVHDPFATIDPAHDLDHVGLSPIGVAHLYREYFFELASFLGPPVGHVWLSPGSTVELVEVHTRRELIEQTVEKSLENVRKSEKDTTTQDELSDAVKEDNSNNTKLGVNVSANQTWGWGSANESASFDFATTEQRAREQTHRTMRQQSDKLSEEIKQSFKTTFRTVTETTDMSSKRYLLTNDSKELVNYELRRKMRQVAIQVQDIGSYLCWQTYVDDPGAALGLGRLVHIGAPPDLTAVPPPETILPPKAFDQDINITIPFITSDGADNDNEFIDGKEAEVDWIFDKTNHIAADIQQEPVRCPQAGFRLSAVTVDAQGHNAVLTVNPSTIAPAPGTSDAFTFIVHLKHINFGGS
ncbi:MAG TPA: hypothetical protein VJQ84_04915, partial [Solirubrobacterales bacterium]|nr:hypothetical protein [Solirubrobacterales bacterium]